jgi:hypothetical protein
MPSNAAELLLEKAPCNMYKLFVVAPVLGSHAY